MPNESLRQEILSKFKDELHPPGIVKGVGAETVNGDCIVCGISFDDEPKWRELREKLVDIALAAIKKRLPEHKPAHTYASENEDDYWAYDNGFKDCLKQFTAILDSPAEGAK